jgi:hypothetical protein
MAENTWRLSNILLHISVSSKKTRKVIKKFLDSNEYEITTYQNLWDTEKAVLRGKFCSYKCPC